MATLLERLAEELARDALKQVALTGDKKLIDTIAKSLGDTSATFEEAFLTSVRYYSAEARARELLPDFQPDDSRALPSPDAIVTPPPSTKDDTPPKPEPVEEEEIPYAQAEIVDDEESPFSKD